MKPFRVLITVLLMFSATGLAIPILSRKKDAALDIASPGGSLRIQFQLKDGSPFYSVLRGKEVMVSPSALGFTFRDLPPLSRDFKVISFAKSGSDTTWIQPWGETRQIRDHYNGLTIFLEEQSGARRKLNLYFRAYDDGVAFRYEIPAQPNMKNFVIMDELTEFALTPDLNAWWIPAYGDNMDSEYLYQRNKIGDMKQTVHTPLTMSSTQENLFISIHEAALMDYAAGFYGHVVRYRVRGIHGAECSTHDRKLSH